MVIESPAELPLGIFELDGAGRVMAFSVNNSRLAMNATRALVGKDFFNDVLRGCGEASLTRLALKQGIRTVRRDAPAYAATSG